MQLVHRNVVMMSLTDFFLLNNSIFRHWEITWNGQKDGRKRPLLETRGRI